MAPFQKLRPFYPLWITAALLILLASGCRPASPAPATAGLVTLEIEASEWGLTVPERTQAGLVRFDMQNTGQIVHGPIIARLNGSVTLDMLERAFSENPEAAFELVTLLGGSELPPGGFQSMILNLGEGAHVVMDFFGEQPFFKPLLVVPGLPAEPIDADVQVDLLDNRFDLPAEIPAGPREWHIRNQGQQWHELRLVRLNEGLTEEDLLQRLQDQRGLASPPFELIANFTPLDEGLEAWAIFDLPPGSYTVLDFLPDPASQQPHAMQGMVAEFEVK